VTTLLAVHEAGLVDAAVWVAVTQAAFFAAVRFTKTKETQ